MLRTFKVTFTKETLAFRQVNLSDHAGAKKSPFLTKPIFWRDIYEHILPWTLAWVEYKVVKYLTISKNKEHVLSLINYRIKITEGRESEF